MLIFLQLLEYNIYCTKMLSQTCFGFELWSNKGLGGQKSVMWSLPWPCPSNIRHPLMSWTILLMMMVLIDCEPWLWVRGLMGHRWPGSWRRRQFLLGGHHHQAFGLPLARGANCHLALVDLLPSGFGLAQPAYLALREPYGFGNTGLGVCYCQQFGRANHHHLGRAP